MSRKGKTYVVEVPARGTQTFLVENATSKADALRKARAHVMTQNDTDVDPLAGSLDVLYWSTATVSLDEKG
jgi:hypothetical protein